MERGYGRRDGIGRRHGPFRGCLGESQELATCVLIRNLLQIRFNLVWRFPLPLLFLLPLLLPLRRLVLLFLRLLLPLLLLLLLPFMLDVQLTTVVLTM